MKSWACALLIVAMVALHQDNWLWRDARLLFGFLPIGLAYHVGYSLLAALVMWGLVRLAWPAHLERYETDLDRDTPQEKLRQP